MLVILLMVPLPRSTMDQQNRLRGVASGSRSLGLTTFISHLIGEEILQCSSHLSVGTCQVGRFLLCKIFFWAGDNPISETITQLKSQSWIIPYFELFVVMISYGLSWLSKEGIEAHDSLYIYFASFLSKRLSVRLRKQLEKLFFARRFKSGRAKQIVVEKKLRLPLQSKASGPRGRLHICPAVGTPRCTQVEILGWIFDSNKSSSKYRRCAYMFR